MLSNKAYDIIRTICEVALPALSAAYYSLAELWGLPMAKEICGTLAILGTLIGAFISVERKQYNKAIKEAEQK